MATISIADNDARIQHSIGSGGNTADSTTFTIDFPFFALDDINVIITNSSGVDTTLTRGSGTNTFAVSGTAVDDGFSGGNVTLGSVYTSSTVTIFRDIPVTRTTDFATSGPFNIASLNTELDRIIAIEQELETALGRTLTLPASDATASLVLPNVDTRKGKTLAFNASSGAVEAGPSIGGITSVNAMAADIAALADIEDGTVATDAISDLAAIKANVTTVAGIASNVTSVAGISSNIASVVGNASNINSAVSNASNINSAVANQTNINSAVSNASNINSAVSNASNINTVAGNNSNITTVAGINGDVTTVAGISSDVAAVENISANITTVAGVASNVTTVAGVSGNVTTIAGISSDVTTLANALSATTTYAVTVANVGGVNVFVLDSSNNPAIQLDRGNTYIFDQSNSSNAGHTLAFKNGSASYTTGVTTTGTAGQAGAKTTIVVDAAAPSSGLLYYCVAHGNAMGNAITTVTSNFAVVASNMGNINTVAGSNSNINTVAGMSAAITTVNNSASAINAVNSNATNINTVSAANTNVNNVAGAITNINTVATNLTNVNNFADRYRIASSDPTSSLDGGDLAYNTSANQLRFYNGSAWVGIAPGLSSVSADSGPQLGGDLNVGSNSIISSSNGDIAITPNGTGDVILDGLKYPQADGSNGQFLKTDGSGQLSFGTVSTPSLASLSIANHDNLTVDGSGNVALGTSSIAFGSSKWTIVVDDTNNTLDFAYNGTVVFSLASNGAAISANNVTAFGTP